MGLFNPTFQHSVTPWLYGLDASRLQHRCSSPPQQAGVGLLYIGFTFHGYGNQGWELPRLSRCNLFFFLPQCGKLTEEPLNYYCKIYCKLKPNNATNMKHPHTFCKQLNLMCASGQGKESNDVNYAVHKYILCWLELQVVFEWHVATGCAECY